MSKIEDLSQRILAFVTDMNNANLTDDLIVEGITELLEEIINE